MHDLNIINRLNSEAWDAAVQKHRAAGRYVLLTHAGATLTTIETFSDEVMALAALAQGNKAPATSEHAKLLYPTGPSPVAEPDAAIRLYLIDGVDFHNNDTRA
jgi:hypothetical protein